MNEFHCLYGIPWANKTLSTSLTEETRRTDFNLYLNWGLQLRHITFLNLRRPEQTVYCVILSLVPEASPPVASPRT